LMPNDRKEHLCTMRTFLHTLLLCFAGTLCAQPFSIGTTSITFFDAGRNRNIPCELHYPADAAGTDVALTSGAFPVLVIGHGFVMTVDAYTYLWQHYAPLGYIVALPTTEGGFAPAHASFGADLAYVADALQAANADGASIFFGHVAPATALMGHSMGGGAAFLGAAGNGAIQTLVTFAAAETNPSAIAAAAQVSVPSLVFAASEDCVTPIAAHTQPMYDALNVVCKAFVNITGGGHCYFGDNNALCSFGEFTCAPDLTISREQQHDVVTDVTDLWLGHHLLGSSAALSDLLDSLSTSARYQALNTCFSTSEMGTDKVPFRAFWNVSDGSLLLDGLTQGAYVEFTNTLGVVMTRELVTSTSMRMAMPARAAGLYHVRQCVEGRCTTRSVVVRP
jgi:pimeloyl-ACP methyl ester carboxylesterase